MSPLVATFASTSKAQPSVWCDWYRRPAAVTNGRCALCQSRLHRLLSEVVGR